MYELHIRTNGWWFRSISIRLNMLQFIFFWWKLEANLINFEPILIMKSMNCASNDQSTPFILAVNSIEIAANFSHAKTACSGANFSAIWNLKQIEENFLKRSIINFHPCTPFNRFNILGKLWENRNILMEKNHRTDYRLFVLCAHSVFACDGAARKQDK